MTLAYANFLLGIPHDLKTVMAHINSRYKILMWPTSKKNYLGPTTREETCMNGNELDE